MTQKTFTVARLTRAPRWILRNGVKVYLPAGQSGGKVFWCYRARNLATGRLMGEGFPNRAACVRTWTARGWTHKQTAK